MGTSEYGLKSLADDQLLSGLACIVHRRNQITAEFLAYLAELDERQLFLDLGFSSLFEYCTVKLGLCESTAGRHIAAARVCRNYPQVFDMVAPLRVSRSASSGALHASALSLLRKHLTLENAAELLELCSRRSARKVEELLAAQFPRPDVNDLVRRLPARTARTLDVGCSAEQTSIVEASRERPTETPSQFIVLGPAPEQRPEQKTPVESLSRELAVAPGTLQTSKPRRLEPLSADRYGVHFTADREFRALLERVRGLAGHRLPSGDLMTLLKRGLEAYERELEKDRFAVGRKTRRSRHVALAPEAPAVSQSGLATPDQSELDLGEIDSSQPVPPSSRRKRHHPAEVVRAVFLRDGKRCSYVSSDGRRCSARRCLELDHIEPLAVGGEDTVENLRLRCRAHNQRYARQYFGTSRVLAAIQASRRRRSQARDRAAGR